MSENEYGTLSDRIIARLTAEGDWRTADEIIDLAPIKATPIVAYRHELDDPEHDPGFGSDATGLAEHQPGGTRDLPDRHLLIDTLLALVREQRVELKKISGTNVYRAPVEKI